MSKIDKTVIMELCKKFKEERNYDLIFLNGNFYLWSGYCYEPLLEYKLKKEVALWLGKKTTIHLVNSIVELFKWFKVIESKEVNLNDKILIFKNGSYDLDNYQFKELDYSHELKKIHHIPFNYDESKQCPIFLNFLNQMTENDQTKIDVIQEMFGYCLTDSCNLEKAFILYGEGSNGKSTLINVLKKIIGDAYISNVPMNKLHEAFSRSSLYGKKLNIATELDGSIKESLYFKALVSGEDVDAQYKFKDTFSFKNTAKLIFATNILPMIADKSNAIYRRLILISCNHNFSKDIKTLDINFSSKLNKEIEGIIIWAIEGYKRLITNKRFTESESINQSVENMRKENNHIYSFIEDVIEIDKNSITTKKEVFMEYLKWCKEYNYHSLNDVIFQKYLKSILNIEDTRIRIEGDRERIYKGIRIYGSCPI